MADCDGSLSFRDDVLRCELSAGHDPPCKCDGMSFRRVQSAQAAFATARAVESQTTTSKGSGRAPNDPLVEPGECQCSACGKPCGTCSCPRVYVYKTTANQRRSDAARRDTPQRVDAHSGRCASGSATPASASIADHDSADPKRKDGRCTECGKTSGEGVTWIARQCRRVLNDVGLRLLSRLRNPRGLQEVQEVRGGLGPHPRGRASGAGPPDLARKDGRRSRLAGPVAPGPRGSGGGLVRDGRTSRFLGAKRCQQGFEHLHLALKPNHLALRVLQTLPSTGKIVLDVDDLVIQGSLFNGGSQSVDDLQVTTVVVAEVVLETYSRVHSRRSRCQGLSRRLVRRSAAFLASLARSPVRGAHPSGCQTGLLSA